MQRNTYRIMKDRIALAGLFVVILFSTFLTSCYDSDDVGGNLYTFTELNIGEYLSANPDEYSEFWKLLDKSDVGGLLDGYGAYTCFAPDNEAMKQYYQAHGKSGLDEFHIDSLKEMAFDHIIKGDTILTIRFNVGYRLIPMSMSERYFLISMDSESGFFQVNGAPVLQKDIRLHNGVVHKLGKVIEPVREGIVEVISKDSRFSLFYEALLYTGLADSLLRDKDEKYVSEEKYFEDWRSIIKSPPSKRYGYTVFMENDTTLANYGIFDLTTMKIKAAEIYDPVFPEDAGVSDVRNGRNSLNRFIAYHLLKREVDMMKMIDAYDVAHVLKTVDLYEYLEPICPNTLIEVSKVRALFESNLLNYIPGTNEAVRITSNNNNQASNGVYHEVDKLLVYSKSVDDMLATKRLRFDAASFFDEFANNNMRGLGMTTFETKNLGFYIPQGYCERLQSSDQTSVTYLTSFEAYLDYQGDELWLVANSGKLYDFTMTTPPIPAGNYEVRFGYQPTGFRGVAQIYFDGQPAGLPINFSNNADVASIGYEKPGSVADDLNGYQNDKMMRNRGYMKGPACILLPNNTWYTGPSARVDKQYLRKILGTFVFDKRGHHTITVKGLSNGEFMFDFVEFIPTSAIENEDVY